VHADVRRRLTVLRLPVHEWVPLKHKARQCSEVLDLVNQDFLATSDGDEVGDFTATAWRAIQVVTVKRVAEVKRVKIAVELPLDTERHPAMGLLNLIECNQRVRSRGFVVQDSVPRLMTTGPVVLTPHDEQLLTVSRTLFEVPFVAE
jgi:hypothetical protein